VAQRPPAHVAEPFGNTGHDVVQLPQWAMLDLRSTQAPEHAVVPAGQTLVHFPAEHASMELHDTSQDPQCVGSALVCTHEDPHRTSPCSHVKSHLPCTQTAIPKAGTLHACPHAPQFAASLVVSMHE
jgi:hypothetical protein